MDKIYQIQYEVSKSEIDQSNCNILFLIKDKLIADYICEVGKNPTGELEYWLNDETYIIQYASFSLIKRSKRLLKENFNIICAI